LIGQGLMSESGRQQRPGAAAADVPELDHETPAILGPRHNDRSQPLRDPMAFVRYEREQASAQIARSLRAWRKASGSAAPASIPQAGSALPKEVRARMEPKLGANLSGVTINTGGEAATAADSMNAKAFTVGQDIHFGAGQYAPGTKEGDRLLALELTHAVQGQRSGPQRKAAEHDGGGGGEKADATGAEHEVSQPGRARREGGGRRWGSRRR
jgi:hypothetical protein